MIVAFILHEAIFETHFSTHPTFGMYTVKLLYNLMAKTWLDPSIILGELYSSSVTQDGDF